MLNRTRFPPTIYNLPNEQMVNLIKFELLTIWVTARCVYQQSNSTASFPKKLHVQASQATKMHAAVLSGGWSVLQSESSFVSNERSGNSKWLYLLLTSLSRLSTSSEGVLLIFAAIPKFICALPRFSSSTHRSSSLFDKIKRLARARLAVLFK